MIDEMEHEPNMPPDDMGPPREFPEAILERVALHFGVSIEDMQGPGRRQSVMLPRAHFARIMREQGRSLDEIGEHLGGRDHSSVWSLLKRFDNEETEQ